MIDHICLWRVSLLSQTTAKWYEESGVAWVLKWDFLRNPLPVPMHLISSSSFNYVAIPSSLNLVMPPASVNRRNTPASCLFGLVRGRKRFHLGQYLRLVFNDFESWRDLMFTLLIQRIIVWSSQIPLFRWMSPKCCRGQWHVCLVPWRS